MTILRYVICCSVLALTLLSSMAMAQDWSPTPMVIDAQDVVEYDFDGTEAEIPFSLEGKNAKIWLVVETALEDGQKPVAVKNGFRDWHFVNGIDTTIYVSPARNYDVGASQVFPWDGTGNESQYEDRVSTGQVAAGTYNYYLWGYDDESSRELVCDFLPIGSYWEGQYLRFYVNDETGAPYETPMLMGQLPFFHASTISGNYDEILGRGDLFKWKVGDDPTDTSLLETSEVLGFESGEVFDDYMVGYGAGVFDPRDHDVFYFAKNYYWEQNQTAVKYQYVGGGQAVEDTDWGGYDNVEWFHPGNKTDYSQRSVINNWGDEYLVMLDGGQNALTYQHDKIHVFSIDDPTDEPVNIQLDEFYMPNQPEYNGAARTSSEINRLFKGKKDGTFFVTGDYSCLQECIDIKTLIEEGGNLDPYTEDGSGYVVWANSNGDFWFDMSPYENPDDPTQLWACIVSRPSNLHNPREEFQPADMNGFLISYTEFTGTNSIGVYTPDGSGMEYAAFGDDAFAAGGSNAQKKGGGEMMDYGGQFDGMYMLAPLVADVRYHNVQYLKTMWIAFDSSAGIITDHVAVEEADAPGAFTVAQNSPNPFNPTTTINFSLVSEGQVSVDVYNVAGQKIDTLVNDFMTAGNHSVVWDAQNFAAGVYFYTVKSGDFSKTMKMTLLR